MKTISKFRIFPMLVGSLLIGLGLIISLVTIAGPLSTVQPTTSPFDQADDILVPESGVAPTVVATHHLSQVVTQKPSSLTAKKTQNPPTTVIPLTESPLPIWIPSRIVIPAIQLDAPIVSAMLRTIAYMGKNYPQWEVPDFFAAGWAPTSASLETDDNTVLFGHHNTKGEIFAHLADLQVNDLIIIYADKKKFAYIVTLKMILLERNQSVDIRLQNARWILPSDDERLTLLTCWPYASNTHRLIIVALPILVDDFKNYQPVPRLTP